MDEINASTDLARVMTHETGTEARSSARFRPDEPEFDELALVKLGAR